MTVSDQEPDYRFTLANERTFLAWIRTSLALIAGGVGLMQLVPSFGISGVKHGLSLVLVMTGGTLSALSLRRWRQVQDVMRRQVELPASRLPVALAGVLLMVTVLLFILIVLEPGVAVDVACGALFGDGAFDDAGFGAEAAVREQVLKDGVADGADEVDDGVSDDAGGQDDLVAGGVEGDGEARTVSGAGGAVASDIAMRSAW